MSYLNDLTIIIVTYRTNKEILFNCIDSIDSNDSIESTDSTNSIDSIDSIDSVAYTNIYIYIYI